MNSRYLHNMVSDGDYNDDDDYDVDVLTSILLYSGGYS